MQYGSGYTAGIIWTPKQKCRDLVRMRNMENERYVEPSLLVWMTAVAGMILAIATECNCQSVYTVGVGLSNGWVTASSQSDYQDWADQREFHVNDTLHFEYAKGVHNVFVAQTYAQMCSTIANPIALGTSGLTEITLLTDNTNYYIMSRVAYGTLDDCKFGFMSFTISVGSCKSNNQPGYLSPSPAPSSVTDPSCNPNNSGLLMNDFFIRSLSVTSVPWTVHPVLSSSSLVLSLERSQDGRLITPALAFKYSRSDNYSVYRAQEYGFISCDSSNATEVEFGASTILSEPGVYYFIDGNRFRCQNNNMKLAVHVNAAAPAVPSRRRSSTVTYVVAVVVSVSVALGISLILYLYRKEIARRWKTFTEKGKSYDAKEEKAHALQDKQREDRMMTEKNGMKTCKMFTLKEMEVATSQFSKGNEVGSGAFGTVYKGRLKNGELVAVKRAMHQRPTEVEQYLNEVSILSQVNHCNLVKLLGCCLELRVPLLVYEFIPNGTLQDHLRQSQQGQSTTLDWRRRFNIAVQTAEALKYLHSQATPPIVHRDVKAANILLDNEFRAKVADFGISKLVETGATHISTAIKGTPGYMDPEYYYNSQLTDKSDVYSYGMVLLELITSKKPIDLTLASMEQNLAVRMVPVIVNKGVRDIVDTQLLKELSEEEFETVESVAEVAVACLGKGRDSRPSMAEVVEMLHTIRGSKLQADSFFRRDGIPVENLTKLSDDWIFNSIDSIGESSSVEGGTPILSLNNSSVDSPSPSMGFSSTSVHLRTFAQKQGFGRVS